MIAEIKLRSPSAGTIRRAQRRAACRRSRASTPAAGAAAISVLVRRAGLRRQPARPAPRAARASSVPLLFKEFVLDPLQVELARAVGAHMVLLLVRALAAAALRELVDVVLARGMAPVVEAADEDELEVALATPRDVDRRQRARPAHVSRRPRARAPRGRARFRRTASRCT